eukprot:TRINITY_DN18942_c0_g1_i1.p2 TRINITY_DN18942_c0_g1~~TRINITY_DN18942_c0_g1_i1.p2  ORF type:complete len:122 (+),score=8.05 TRINITY_DN18942_c0_g1_i1:303-668(+)
MLALFHRLEVSASLVRLSEGSRGEVHYVVVVLYDGLQQCCDPWVRPIHPHLRQNLSEHIRACDCAVHVRDDDFGVVRPQEDKAGDRGLGEATCLLYTSDAADEEDSVDLGGRRIIKKKKTW